MTLNFVSIKNNETKFCKYKENLTLRQIGLIIDMSTKIVRLNFLKSKKLRNSETNFFKFINVRTTFSQCKIILTMAH